ncbi:uncharacterized protein LOC34619292 [Cyclospora cayetanensis]|uniref:Uncharacterized protein n=2 Tax=Cyclospora cayetanensis TaxID=88456 RepID=A0A1D3CYZ2_9EIME|nr:uncharacterized protein LOC34619292 [Cyclospora cayetanensis]OEH76423.1 hypothetical protein cyc_02436 [Cyclospora cayetanensis]
MMSAPVGAAASAASGSRRLLLRTSPLLLQSSDSAATMRYGAVQQQLLHALVRHQPGMWERTGNFVYRWLDVTGFLTRWNSRQAWILDLDPYSRLATPLITEYERKMIMFVGLHAYFFFGVALYLAYKGHAHGAVKPPVPSNADFVGLDGRKKDFTWHGRLFFISPKERCKECRWLDLECKKNCFEALKAQGHKLILNHGNPLSVPRGTLKPFHTH